MVKNIFKKIKADWTVVFNVTLVAAVIILAAINIYLLFNYVPAGNVSGGGAAVNPYPLLDPARRFYKSDDLIINIQPLRDYLNNKYEADPNVSVYFEFLNTGANIVIGKDAEFFPASLLKVPVAMAVAKKIESGGLKWSDEIMLLDADKNKDFGNLWQAPSGSSFTVEELVKQVLIDSDNTAHFMLLRNLGSDDLVKVQEHLGLLDFFDKNGKISAKKYSPILHSLYSASYLTTQDSEKILQWMAESRFKDYRAVNIPESVKFANKIGVSDDKKVYLDAGIVYQPDRPYALIIMVNDYDSAKAKEIIQDIGQRTYSYIANYPQSAAGYKPQNQ
jgi:beta-lactamase class A